MGSQKILRIGDEGIITRRDALILVGGAAASVALAAVSGPISRLAFADGGGEGDSSDWVPGGDEPSYYGFMWVYRDAGGFVDTEDGVKRNSEFGWNEDSLNGFWDGPMRSRWNEVGNHLFGGSRNFGWFAFNDVWASYTSAAREALAAARRRAHTDKARIVAVGWSVGYYSTSDGGIGTMYINKWSSDRTRANMLPRNGQNTYTGASDTGGDGAVKFRVGNSLSDLGQGIGQNNAGWSDQARDENNTVYDTWYDYLWHIYQSGSSASENGYVFIVLAVADTEPVSHGYLKVRKQTGI